MMGHGKKRISVLPGLLILWMCCLLMCPSGVSAYPNDPDGFRAIRWQTLRKDIGALRVHERYGGYVEYVKDREDLIFEGVQATRILYGFTDDRLEDVTVQFEPVDAARYQSLKNALIARYGEGEAIGEKDLFWRGGTTNITLNVYGMGVEITYSDNHTSTQRVERIDAFNARFNARWNELLGDHDPSAAARMIRQWLKQEGEVLLDGYHVSRTGDQISLNFKGGGTYLFHPSPLNLLQELESEQVYSVRQISEILAVSPDRLKNKDVFIRAVAVDGTRGIGCHDYKILTDLEFEDMYKKKYDLDLTPAEKEAIANIPILISGPSLGMPKEIDQPIRGIYRGHFFDNSLKPCDEGWKRFVITDK